MYRGIDPSDGRQRGRKRFAANATLLCMITVWLPIVGGSAYSKPPKMLTLECGPRKERSSSQLLYGDQMWGRQEQRLICWSSFFPTNEATQKCCVLLILYIISAPFPR
jgi:hypothetical protein